MHRNLLPTAIVLIITAACFVLIVRYVDVRLADAYIQGVCEGSGGTYTIDRTCLERR